MTSHADPCRSIRLALAAAAWALVAIVVAGCHHGDPVLPVGVPYFEGIVQGSSFTIESKALSHLTRISLRGRMRNYPGAPSGYFRIGTTTRFVVATERGLRWETAGVPGLMGSRARIWFRNDRPTSLTGDEVWADARLVVIDSVGAMGDR